MESVLGLGPCPRTGYFHLAFVWHLLSAPPRASWLEPALPRATPAGGRCPWHLHPPLRSELLPLCGPLWGPVAAAHRPRKGQFGCRGVNCAGPKPGWKKMGLCDFTLQTRPHSPPQTHPPAGKLTEVPHQASSGWLARRDVREPEDIPRRRGHAVPGRSGLFSPGNQAR